MAGGAVDLEIIDNDIQRDNGTGIYVRVQGFNGRPQETNPPCDRRIVIARNQMETASDGIDIDLHAINGHPTFVADANFIEAEDNGIQLDQPWPGSDFGPIGGRSRVSISDNEFFSLSAAIDLDVRAAEPDSEVVIDGNRCLVNDDDATDFQLWDVARTSLTGNVFRSVYGVNTDINLDATVDPDVSMTTAYSLVGEDPTGAPGYMSLIGDPIFERCAEAFDFNACFQIHPQSPAIDAGHPGDDYLDLDGPPNDIGAFGGPHAGPLGAYGEPRPVPLETIALRPLSELYTGAALMRTDATPTLVFTRPVDPATVSEDTIAVTDRSLGVPVDGRWQVFGHRAVFIAGDDLAAGHTFEIRVGAITADDGHPATRAFVHHFSTAPTAIADAIEPDDTAASAHPLIGRVFAAEGELAPWLPEVDPPIGPDDPEPEPQPDTGETFAFEAEAGDRLMTTVFAQRLTDADLPRGVRLQLTTEDGENIIDFDDGLMDAGHRSDDPYLDHVFDTPGRYRLRVYTEPAGDDSIAYRLEGVLRAL